MKVKVGTQLEDEVYRELKVVAAREKRPISDIIQHALTDFLQRARARANENPAWPGSWNAKPLKVTDEQFREALELDYFDQ